MFTVKEMIAISKEIADPVREVQGVAKIGLGDTLCDAWAAGCIRARMEGTSDDHGRPLIVETGAMLAHGFTRWYGGGLPRFRLSHGLAAKLAMTDPDGIAAEDIRLPFPTFMIELPYPNGPLVATSIDGEHSTDILTILVSRYFWAEGIPDLSFNHHSIAEYIKWCEKVKSDLVWNVPAVHACVISHNTIIHQRNPMIGPLVINKAGSAIEVSSLTRRCTILAWRLVFNLALYLKHVDSSFMSNGGRTVNHDHGLQSILYEVGSEVKLSRELRDVARSFCQTGAAHEKWKLEKRFIVRGHWKNQACGEDLSERKMIFVEPYWKGPADAPVLARVYTDEPKR